MHEHLALFKLLSFKIVVALDAVQVIVFPILAENRVFQPSPPWLVSWNDFALVLPNFMLAIEMVFVAVGFIWSFDFTRYRNQIIRDGEPPRASPGAAFLDVLNISDIWAGVAYAFWGRTSSSWYESTESGEALRDGAAHDNENTDYDANKIDA